MLEQLLKRAGDFGMTDAGKPLHAPGSGVSEATRLKQMAQTKSNLAMSSAAAAKTFDARRAGAMAGLSAGKKPLQAGIASKVWGEIKNLVPKVLGKLK